MTLTLATLRERYVFESTPQRHNLAALHVPFDGLVGDDRTEARLHGAIHRNEPAAVIGASGSGKSSVIAHVLDPLEEDVAPLLIPVAVLPTDTVDTPAHLLDHLVNTVGRQAQAALDVDSGLATHIKTVTTIRKRGVAAGWGWIKDDLAREVTRQTQIERTATFVEKAEVFQLVLEAIAGDDLQPVLVFDDTDRWLGSHSNELVEQFFREGLRWLLEFGTGIVAAVHPSYFTIAPKTDLLQYLDTQITVPHLAEPAAIGSIAARRVEMYADIRNPDLDDVMSDDALAAIHQVYENTASLRRAIHVSHTAVHEALDAGDTLLTANHIIAADNAG